MPDNPTRPDATSGQQRFRADLVAYLDSLSVHELGELLGELPSIHHEPLQLGVLMIALNERLPDSHKLLPPAGQPGPDEGRRRSLREVVADRRAARRAGPPERSLGLQGEERDSEREDDFDHSWRTYRERADQIRQTYGWTVPEPPPRAENWLPLGRDDDQEHDEPPAGPPDRRSRRRRGEERDSGHEDR
jgi:hypothetical protein